MPVIADFSVLQETMHLLRNQLRELGQEPSVLDAAVAVASSGSLTAHELPIALVSIAPMGFAHVWPAGEGGVPPPPASFLQISDK
jgi:hypothetical protein